MRNLIIAVCAVLVVAGVSFGVGDLQYTDGKLISSGTPIQACAPTAGLAQKSLGTGKASTFANYTTTNVACLNVQGYSNTTAAPTAAAVVYRVGGFATGLESDVNILPSTGGTIWLGSGVTKVGFRAISSATTTNKISGSYR